MTDADQSHDSKILVLIPTLNEEAYIADCIQSLIGPDSKNICVGVIDGQSSDATVSIVRDLQAYLPNLHLIENPKRLQSAAINLGVEILATEETRVIVRCDAHSVYPPGFVRNVATRLLEQKSASVVVPMDAIGRTCFERANAWIVDTPLGSGGSAHRGGTTSGYIDHGHHAGFDIDWFRKNGGYDETFSHNEDAEYDLRLVQAGGKIFMDADIRIGYYPRGRLSALARQYFNYGKGRARTCLKHGQTLKIRQFLPVALVLGLIFSVLLAAVSPVFLAPIVIYTVTLVGVSLVMLVIKKSFCGLFCGPVLAAMHIAWGSGFLKQTITTWANKSL